MKKKKPSAQAGASPTSEPARLKAIRLLAAPAAGLLLVSSFPPYNLSPVAWLALAPLAWSLEAATLAGAALRGYLFGVAYFASLFWWIAVCRYPASLGFAAFAVVIPVIFIPWAILANRAMQRAKPAFKVLLPAALWVLLEYSMSHGMLALPWWSLAYTQSRNLVTSQIASIGGMFLISFVVAVFNFSLFTFVKYMLMKRAAKGKSAPPKPARADIAMWAAAAALLVFTLAYGAFELTRTFGTDRPITLALIQPSFDQSTKEQQVSDGVFLQKHIEMTDRAVQERHPDMVAWPESVTFLSWLNGPTNRDAWLTRIMIYNTTLVTGVYNWDDRERSYNSVAAFDPERGYLGEYRKMQIVPFGEAVPYRSTVEKISPWAGKWLDENVYEYDTFPGHEYKLFKSRMGNFAVMICFESVFPQYAREFTRRGAEFLFVVTDDAWFLRSPAAYQHAAMAAIRAVENRRFVVQAANSGVSGFYDPYGRAVAETKLFDVTTLFGTIYPQNGLTLYTRIGDVIVWLCGAFAIVALAALAATRGKQASAPEKSTPPPADIPKKKKRKR